MLFSWGKSSQNVKFNTHLRQHRESNNTIPPVWHTSLRCGSWLCSITLPCSTCKKKKNDPFRYGCKQSIQFQWFILQFALWQFHSPFQSHFSTQCHQVLTLSFPVSPLFIKVTQLLLMSSSSPSRHFNISIYLSLNNVFYNAVSTQDVTFSLRLPSSCLRLLPRLPVISIFPSIVP